MYQQFWHQRTPLEPLLPNINMPTLLLWGDQDKILDVSAEQVSSQLGAAHVIEDFLVLLQALALVDFLDAKPSVQTLIAVILEDGVIPRFNDTGPSRRVGKLDVVRPHLLTQPQAPLRFICLIAEFLPPRLYRKVRLPERHPRLTGVRILNRQIASVPREQRRLDGPLGAAPNLDHFGDINEMV